jgi:hypothetical protein
MFVLSFSTYILFISDIVLSIYLFVNDLDRLLPLPKDYISDNFNLAQLPLIVERIGYQAMEEDAIHVAKALQQQRIATTAAAAAASAAVITNSGTSSTVGQPIATIAEHKSSSSLSYPIYRRALRLILNEGIEDDQDDIKTDKDLIIPPYAIQKAAEALYLMIHARFVISPRGLEAIRQVMTMDNTVFGKCPRSTCRGTGLLPYGYYNDYTSANTATSTSTSKSSLCHRYCPSCGEVWTSWDSKTDGCAWGPSWCHLFLLCFGSQVYAKELIAAAAAAATTTVSATTTPTNASRRTPYYNNSYAPTFLPRSRSYSSSNSNSSSGARDLIDNDNSINQSSDSSSSCPTPSVFGFRIHPATSFGRPLNEQTKSSLRGGSSNGFQE